MGWGGKLVGGIIGFAVGGPIGAVAGAALGHSLVDRGSNESGVAVTCPHCRATVRISGEGLWTCPQCSREFNYGDGSETPSDRMMEAFKTIFAMLGKLAKSDGQVSQVEVQVIDQFAVGQLGLNPEQRRVLAATFNESRNSTIPFESYAQSFRRIFGDNPNMTQGIIELFMQVAMADGHLDAAEERLILTAVDIFGLSRDFYQQVKHTYTGHSGAGPRVVENNLDHCYQVLGCTRQDSTETIKSNYRKLVREYHPDTIAGKGLPQSFTDFAHEKFCEIQEAYEKVMETRKAG